MLVLLRLTIGWHFCYEGVWKITHSEFSAKPFLTQAKGPAAPLFYAMVPDIDGRQRLAVQPIVDASPIRDAWQKARVDAIKRYTANLAKRKTADGEPLPDAAERIERFTVTIDKIFWVHDDRLAGFLYKQQADLVGVFEKLGASPPAADGGEIPPAVVGWLSSVKAIERDYYKAVTDLVDKDRGEKEPELSLEPYLPDSIDDATLEDIVHDSMLWNPDGRALLGVGDGITGRPYVRAWKTLKSDLDKACSLTEEQQYQAEKLYRLYRDSARDYLAANVENIAAYMASLDRFEARKQTGSNGAEHEGKRIWDEQQKLRSEVNGWLSELDTTGENYQASLWNLLTDDQKALAPIGAALCETGKLPFSLFGISTREKLIDVSVTYGLTAIGVCLLVGFCTRLAALGGAAFLVSVLLTQPPWPTIYPPAPAVVGHALVVDKNFVEMIALLVLASTAVGRWGGLDFFIYRCIGRPIGNLLRSEGSE